MQFDREGLARFFQPATDVSHLFVLARSCYGQVREEAVRRLGALLRADALPLLIERLNDWVPQVRDAAQAAIEPLLTEQHAPAFVQHIVQWQQLRHRGRDHHEVIVTRLEAFLATPPQRAHLLAGLHSADRRISRLCLQIVKARSLLDDSEYVEFGLLHNDIAVAIDALARAATMPPEQRRTSAERALSHAAAPVRRDAFRLLLACGIAQERIENFAFDRHAAVRALAARHLRNAGADVAALYRAALASPHPRRLSIAVDGVATHGTVDDIRAMSPLLAHPLPVLRRGALTAWAGRLRFDAADAVVAALSDPAASVASEAARLAAIVRPQLDADTMLAISANPAWTDNRGRLLAAFGFSDKWEQLIFVMLRIVQDGAGDRVGMLRYWETRTNGNCVQPKPAQVERLQHLVDRNDAELLASLRATHCDFMLRSIGVFLPQPATQPVQDNAGAPTPPGLVRRLFARWQRS